MFTCGALVLITSILRVTVIRLKESPKYLLSVGKDADLVEIYHDLARKYNRPCSLTEEALAACGPVGVGNGSGAQQSLLGKLAFHVKGLFTTRKTSATTAMVWASWAITGLAYPLFYVFLPSYLSTRISDGAPGAFETWRNLILTTVAGIPGPILAGYLVGIPALGRKYTMVIGALSGMALFFGFTGVSTQAQNVGISCAICKSSLPFRPYEVPECSHADCPSVLHQRLLQHTLRLHGRGAPVSPQGNREWNCGVFQPTDGHCLGVCGFFWKHRDGRASLCLCGAVWRPRLDFVIVSS